MIGITDICIVCGSAIAMGSPCLGCAEKDFRRLQNASPQRRIPERDQMAVETMWFTNRRFREAPSDVLEKARRVAEEAGHGALVIELASELKRRKEDEFAEKLDALLGPYGWKGEKV